MIEKVLHAIIAELGPTGILVVGLYYILHKPLWEIARCVCEIERELKVLIALSKVVIRSSNGKTDGASVQLGCKR